MTPLLELRDISYSFNPARPVLHHLNLSLTEGKIGLIGPNGSGKTTLLHVMVGLIKPDEGEIFFQGEKVEDKQDIRALRKNIGFLFQSSDDQLFSPTVIEDVAFGPLNLGASQEEAMEKAKSTLQKLGLEGFEERITHRLSGGEKKLVALATILSMDPKLLLLDEPTNNLDPATRSRLIEILQELDLLQVVISHDLSFLDEITDTLHTIEEGRINVSPDIHIHEHHHVHTGGNHPHHH